MKRAASIVIAILSLVSEATVTNLVSNVQTQKKWVRSYATVDDDGTLHDPSGTLLPYSLGQQLVREAESIREGVADLIESYDREVERLEANTNRAQAVTERIYIAGDEEPSMETTNLLCHVVRAEYDGTNDLFTVWYNNALACAPKIEVRYRIETGDIWAEGAWPDGNWTNTAFTCDGFEQCHLLRVPRPSSVGNIVMRPGAYPSFGREDNGFDFQRRVFYLEAGTAPAADRAKLPGWIDFDENILYHTGIFTNLEGRIETYNNGVYTGELENE